MTALRDDSWSSIADDAAHGRLVARPSAPTLDIAPGLYPLGLARGRDALLHVPHSYDAERPAPLVVMLHGAGGDAAHGMSLLRGLADDAGVVLLAPSSRDATWDLLLDDFGPDVDFIDAALDATSERCSIDPERVAICGFSDGASYALSLGLTNGDLFTHVVAFSPGFMAPSMRIGSPRCFLSHGVGDTVLSVARCSRRIVPALEHHGYDVRYREFDGAHVVPADVAREALDWIAPVAG